MAKRRTGVGKHKKSRSKKTKKRLAIKRERLTKLAELRRLRRRSGKRNLRKAVEE